MDQLKLLLAIVAIVSASATATHRPIPVEVVAEDYSAYPKDESYRLPTETYPETYTLDLTWVDEDKFAFEGKVKIGIVIRSDTNTIVVHSRQTTIKSVTIQDQANPNPIALAFEHSTVTDFLTITNPVIMTARSRYTLEITYGGQLRTDNRGFFRQSYVAETGEQRQANIFKTKPYSISLYEKTNILSDNWRYLDGWRQHILSH